jgi:nuclear transport factor 2 (NTF2) superfamily protein
MAPPVIKPPFTAETARAKVQAAQDAWNSRDPARVSLAYTPDSDWRNRDKFIRGRDEIRAFLADKWAREQEYYLEKELFCFSDTRIAVCFQYEWHDAAGQWWRSYGNENWDFDPDGLMERRQASINDVQIAASERRFKGKR